MGRYVLLPGDPFRTDYIASFLDDARLVAHNREHRTWTGTLDGAAVSVTSTGTGGPSAAIAVELGDSFREGIVHCKDSFYGQIDPDGLPGGDFLKARWKAWEKARVMATEMETAAVLVIASIRGCRAGSILSFGSMEATVSVARDALRRLIAADREKTGIL